MSLAHTGLRRDPHTLSKKRKGSQLVLKTLLKISNLMANSWVLPLFVYRLNGIRLTGRPSEEIWYFAYGSNMHDSAFREMRGMNPREWRPGRARGYRLRFNMSMPRSKIAYANVCADPAAEVWGVLYRITRRDLVHLEITEGVPWGGYRPHWLDVEDIDGNVVQASTLMALGVDSDRPPSLRYLTLLREGAQAHGLPTHYIRFLERVEHRP